MNKIDKTKTNIKVDNLSKNNRRDLLNKFIEAGGIIINENGINETNLKAGKNKTIFDREKQPEFKFKNRHPTNTPKKGVKQQTKIPKSALVINKPSLIVSFSQKLLIRLRLYLMNVTDFAANHFNNKFFHLFNTEYKIALMGMKMLHLEIFKQNQDIEYQIIYKLDKINPLDVQLIEDISKLYNENEILTITRDYLKSPYAIQPINSVKEPLLSLFRKLYILKPYEKNILTAFEQSIMHHMKLTNKKSSAYISKRKNLKDDIYIIFEKLFFALYWLFCRYHNKIITLGSPEIEEILKIKRVKKQNDLNKKDNQIPENIISDNNIIEKNKEEGEDKIVKEETQMKLSDELQTEIDRLNHFNPANIDELRKLYDKSKTFAQVTDNDKILYIYLIFQEFDIEYSFLLTTNKIKYKSDYTDSEHINFKEKMMDYYNDIGKCTDSLKEYSNSFEILLKAQNEKPISNDRYIVYMKDINAFTKRREQAASAARLSILTFMNNISNILQVLIEDIKGSNKIIDNPYEIINFEISTEKDKKLNNITFYEGLTQAYHFANAFIFKLSIQGNLSGALEFSETDINPIASETVEKISPETTINTDKKQNMEPAAMDRPEEESIIDELDDILSQ